MTTRTVLLVGATGRLGSHIASALLDRPDVSVRVLSRSETTEGRKALERRGATFFVGDLASASSLDAAVEGAYAVISAVNGGPEVVIEGQSRLLDAAERHGVTRFIPSDYSLNFFALDDGDNMFLDLRRAFAKRIERSKLQYSHVMIGALTEVHLSKFFGIFDLEAGIATPWGTGAEPVDVTTLADSGRFIAEVALDERAPQRISFAGDAISVMDVAAIYARITGRALEVRPRGSIGELEDWIRRRKATARSPLEYVFAQYQLAQINGKGKLYKLDNERHPQIVPTKTSALLDLWLSAPQPKGRTS